MYFSEFTVNITIVNSMFLIVTFFLWIIHALFLTVLSSLFKHMQIFVC